MSQRIFELTRSQDDSWLVVSPEIARELGHVYDPTTDRVLRGGFWNTHIDERLDGRWNQWTLAVDIPDFIAGIRLTWRAR